MSDEEKTISDKLQLAKQKAQIVQHFQYGHNLLQSPVQIDEIFAMLDGIISDITNLIDDVIPDINLAPYKDGYVDPTRANLCWIQLADNYYGLILNTHQGIKYRDFDDDDMENLLLNGQVSSWYLISKIQNLSYLLAVDKNDKNDILVYFKSLIKDIVERFLYEHEHDKQYHPAGKVSFDDLDKVFAKIQIQNTRSLVPSTNLENESRSSHWSTSIIKTETHDICWQSTANMALQPVSSKHDKYILSSKYLNKRSDTEVFLQETYKKYKSNTSLPNVFCFISQDKFTYPYINLNYVVETQLRGYIEVEYTNGDVEKIYPDTQPIIIEKGKNDIAILSIIKLNNDVTKKVKNIVLNQNGYLPNLYLMCSFTGVLAEKESDTSNE